MHPIPSPSLVQVGILEHWEMLRDLGTELHRSLALMRGTVSPANPWDVMVDLFFYRDPEELEDKPAAEETAVVGDTPAGFDASGFGAPVAAGAAEPWDEQAGAAPMGGFGGAPAAGQWNEAPAPAAGTPPRRPWTRPASDRASTSLPAATKRRGCDHGSRGRVFPSTMIKWVFS